MLAQKVSRRLGHRKSTNGCITCKIRHVKCDEEHPSCRRCTSTGRKCDGYKNPYGIKDHKPTTRGEHPAYVDGTLTTLNVDADEYRVLRFFADQAATEIAGSGNTNFWARVVPQLTHSQKAVRHAVIAIGSLMLRLQNANQHALVRSSQAPDYVASEAFALRYYSNAIQATLATIKEGRASTDLAATTCMLFTCFEALQGHETEAVCLFHRGQAALGGPEDALVIKNKSAYGEVDIGTVFDSLTLQFRMFDTPALDRSIMAETALSSIIPQICTSLTSLDEARHEFHGLLKLAQSITSLGMDIKWNLSDPANQKKFAILMKRQSSADLALQLWHARFQKLIEDLAAEKPLTPQQQYIVSMLRQQYYSGRIWLWGSLELFETCYEDLSFMFEASLSEVETIFELEKQIRSTPFSFEIGVIPSLYWTAIKSRDPGIRRRALSLLAQAPRQEGLWDSRIATKVARKAIQLEEEINSDLVVLSGAQSSDSEEVSLPSEEKRIKFIRIHLRSTVDGQEGSVVEMFMLPDGLEGGWHIIKQFVAL